MNPAYQLVEIEYMLRKTAARGLIILDNLRTLHHHSTMTRICPELATSLPGELNSPNLPALKHIFVVRNELVPSADEYKGAWMFSDFERQRSGVLTQSTPHVDADDPVAILFTVNTETSNNYTLTIKTYWVKPK